ncbi:hypothetical protein [Oceanimonas baumannii]|uniref:hypothetical protein n=1 Tax=Oceanimonas baumannii TaxID=129578 RepID=UPI001FD0A62F|nr:hypothetical protein [Oceanimonas baumannii]
MAVGVIDKFEVVDVDQSNHRAPLFIATTLELDFQLIFPRTVVEQAGQAVSTAQGQQFALVPGQVLSLSIADPTEHQWIQHQDRQAGV